MEKYELQKLRDLPIEGVAEQLGLSVRMHKCLCPFHDDHHASLSFSVRRNSYRCFVCGAHGGTIDLVMRCQNKDFLDACRWLSGNEELRMKNEEWAARTTVVPPKPFDASRYERFFLRPWLNEAARRFLFDERRIDERVVRWCRLTSWRDKQGVSWLQIPYFDRQGRLTGIQNRNLVRGALPRFRFPAGSRCTIYNLPVLNRLQAGDALFITEGCSDCWAMLSTGRKAIAIPSATLLGHQDKELLSGLASSLRLTFHMYPDRDAPGERLFMQLQQVLPSLEHHQLPPGCKDFSDYYLLKRADQSPLICYTKMSHGV